MMQILDRNKPIWILVKHNDDLVFEGHQLHWADCYASNVSIDDIEHCLETSMLFEDCTYVIRNMTQSEINQYPEVLLCLGENNK